MAFLIVGLGNIGEEYKQTRHNIGFDVIDALVEKHKAPDFVTEKYAFYTSFLSKGKKVHCIKPTTYMNLSGKAVRHFMQLHKIPLENILVITDDLALPLAKLRLKTKGSDGGHNGLKSIQELVLSSAYPRLRFGIGDDFPRGRQAEYVLGKWKESEWIEVRLGIDKAVEMAEAFIYHGAPFVMNHFNGK